MSLTLNGSSVLECFECSNAIEIHNGMMFDFYPGLPHIIVVARLIAWVIMQACRVGGVAFIIVIKLVIPSLLLRSTYSVC